jgi:hypothetical protein
LLAVRAPARVDFRDVFREEVFRGGTFAPFLRASLRPMAIACFRLFTLRPDPLFSVPFFRRLIVDSTLFEAALPYFAMDTSLPPSSRACPQGQTLASMRTDFTPR